MSHPTPFPDVNEIVHDLRARINTILGDHVIGMYLDGSLALGDFDDASDIDFIVLTDHEIRDGEFDALREMHAEIMAGPSRWADQLEGSYVSAPAWRRFDPANALHPNIERGSTEKLKMLEHSAVWLVHRSVMRAHGIVLSGPPPESMIDPVAPDDLRAVMRIGLRDWGGEILAEPKWIANRDYQSYTVLTVCRMLYTLTHGTVVSKLAAAQWAQETLPRRWAPLIARAWDWRMRNGGNPPAADSEATLALLREAQTR